MAQNQASFTIEDYGGLLGSTTINVGPLTAVNFTAVRAALNTLQTAIDGIIIGEIRKTSISEQFAESLAAVAAEQAQRTVKWLVTYRDTTQFLDVANTINNVGFGNLYSIEIPTADLELLDNNTDELDLTVTEVAAFVTAFEAIQNSPTGGNETEVVSIVRVGRTG